MPKPSPVPPPVIRAVSPSSENACARLDSVTTHYLTCELAGLTNAEPLHDSVPHPLKSSLSFAQRLSTAALTKARLWHNLRLEPFSHQGLYAENNHISTKAFDLA
jgi:hypothetical protein